MPEGPLPPMTATGAATRPPPPSNSSSFNLFLVAQTWMPHLCCAKPESCPSSNPANPLATHGLWPSRSTGGFPTYCSLPSPKPRLSADVSSISRHEWKKHGTCSSMSPSAYFSATASLAPPAPPLLLEATNGGKTAAIIKADELRGVYSKKVSPPPTRGKRLRRRYLRSKELATASARVLISWSLRSSPLRSLGYLQRFVASLLAPRASILAPRAF